MKRDTRSIFDDNYYRLGAVMLSDKFAKLKQAYRDYYAELGCPLPSRGFASASAYRAWVETLKTVDTATTPYQGLLDILSAFNLPDTNENVMAMRWSVLFGKSFNEQFPAIKGNISSKLTGKSHQELWVRIYPWTKKSDYSNYWQFIEVLQKQLTDYRGKEKTQTTFSRDYELYLLYLKAMKLKTKNTSIITTLINMPEYAEFENKYKNENMIDQLRSITSRFNKLLSDIAFL